MASFAPLIGFAGVRFGILEGRNGVYPDWSYQPLIVTRHVPGSNIAISQYLGTPPATVTYRLELDDVATYRRLRALLGEMGRLTLLANFSSAEGAVQVVQDHVYEYLDETLLTGIEDVTFDIDGVVECSATFTRAMDPRTGLAVSP